MEQLYRRNIARICNTDNSMSICFLENVCDRGGYRLAAKSQTLRLSAEREADLALGFARRAAYANVADEHVSFAFGDTHLKPYSRLEEISY